MIVNNRVKEMTADGDCRQEKLHSWKASKKQADTCDRKCNICFNIYMCASNYHDKL